MKWSTVNPDSTDMVVQTSELLPAVLVLVVTVTYHCSPAVVGLYELVVLATVASTSTIG
jgi:hypothetical protein